MSLIILYYMIRRLSVKKVLIIGITIFTCVKLVIWFYETNSVVKRQIDRRILIVWEKGWEGLSESAIKGERDVLYSQYKQRFSDYTYLGVPMEKGLARTYAGYVGNITDISLATVTLRYGVFAGILFLLLLYHLVRRLLRRYRTDKNANRVYNIMVLPLLVAFLSSFNIDLQARQNFIFLFVVCMICFVFDNKVIYHYHLSYNRYGAMLRDPLPATI